MSDDVPDTPDARADAPGPAPAPRPAVRRPRLRSTRDDGRTRKGRRTREHILACAAELVRTRGLRATTVSDVVAAAGVPKGGFYHHFDGKQALGREILARWLAELEQHLLGYLAAEEGPPPLERVAAALDGFLTQQEQGEARGGSAFGNLVTELADDDEEFRGLLAAAYGRLVGAFAAPLERARAAGDLLPEADAVALAEFLVAALEGGILLARVNRDAAVLARVLRAAEAHLWSLRAR
ncbi:MAG: TetR/AcrR family transcriptional regulator [Planctomycetia bacterium]